MALLKQHMHWELPPSPPSFMSAMAYLSCIITEEHNHIHNSQLDFGAH